jgi:hypothetical protein
MKRGLVEWDPRELAPEVLAARVARCQAVLAAHALDAAVLYTSVAQPGLVRYLTHFLPYWNEGVLVLPRAGEPTLFVALSNRVFPWIQATSTLRDVRAARDLGAAAARLLAERGTARVGLVDRGAIPYWVLEALAAGLPAGALVDAPAVADGFALGLDGDELRLRGRAAAIVANALAAVGDHVAGRPASALASELDRTMRLAAAEDTLVQVGPAGRWPGLPTGAPLPERANVLVQAEYKGHWVLVGRTLPADGVPPNEAAWVGALRAGCAPGRSVSEIVAAVRATAGAEAYLYRSDRSAPFTALDDTARLTEGMVVALLALHAASGALYGGTFAVEAAGLRPLAG